MKVVEVKKEQPDKRLQKEKEKGQKEQPQHGLYHSRHYD
jgi:hypothetical protein